MPISKEIVLEVENLSISYATRDGAVRAVRDVSFKICKGEALGLVGESGCGKSTVALATIAYLQPNASIAGGAIRFRGKELLAMKDDELRRLRGSEIAMVYQDPMTTLNPALQMGMQMTEVLTVHSSMSERQAYVRCIEVLHKVNMPDPESVLQRYPHQISGGQQQRVVIAMALLCNPALLIMDEPTTALDVTVAATVLDLIADLRKEFDSAILYISHNLGVVARVCDRVAVMYAGELVEKAPVDDLFADPVHPYTKSLLRCVPTITEGKECKQLCPIPGAVPSPKNLPRGCVFEPRCEFSDGDTCRAEHPLLQTLGEERLVRCPRWGLVRSDEPCVDLTEDQVVGLSIPPVCDPGQALLKIAGIRTTYLQKSGFVERIFKHRKDREVKAVDDITFQVKPGSIVGVVGESGCGKTSLAKTIAGLVAPSGGQMEFMGVDISKAVEQRDSSVTRELQMVFQNPDSTLNPMQTVRQIVSRPLIISKVVPRREVGAEVSRLLTAVKLNDSYLERRPAQLSGGEKQRVAIARAFASRPELVICDEPVSALDVSVQSSVLNTLLRIQEEYGTSLIFISHDLSVVRYLCDYIMVMYLGRVCEFGPVEQIFQPPYHPYTEALLSAVPIPDPSAEQAMIRLEGSVPSVLNPPDGCRFHTRCPRKSAGILCETCEPPAYEHEGLIVYCHGAGKRSDKAKPVIQSRKGTA